MAAKLKKRALAEFQSQVLTEDQPLSGEKGPKVFDSPLKASFLKKSESLSFYEYEREPKLS